VFPSLSAGLWLEYQCRYGHGSGWFQIQIFFRCDIMLHTQSCNLASGTSATLSCITRNGTLCPGNFYSGPSSLQRTLWKFTPPVRTPEHFINSHDSTYATYCLWHLPPGDVWRIPNSPSHLECLSWLPYNLVWPENLQVGVVSVKYNLRSRIP
jgi:hypothetical protein